MRVAVMSDIHGFNLALETVLADIAQQGPFDQIVIAGDLCELGPGPREVLELIWARDITVVQGNTDFDLVLAARDADADPEIRYGVEQIGDDGLAYLSSLPFSHRITPPLGNGANDDLLIVHANPSNLHDPLAPDLNEKEVRDLIGDRKASAISFGHVHVCYIRQLDEILLVDVSAVGNPKDGDLRCKYGILTWNPESRAWTAELRKLPYPLAETEAQFRESGMSKAEKAIRRLRRATYGNQDQ